MSLFPFYLFPPFCLAFSLTAAIQVEGPILPCDSFTPDSQSSASSSACSYFFPPYRFPCGIAHLRLSCGRRTCFFPDVIRKELSSLFLFPLLLLRRSQPMALAWEFITLILTRSEIGRQGTFLSSRFFPDAQKPARASPFSLPPCVRLLFFFPVICRRRLYSRCYPNRLRWRISSLPLPSAIICSERATAMPSYSSLEIVRSRSPFKIRSNSSHWVSTAFQGASIWAYVPKPPSPS